jgi:hypothetical protein
MDSLEVEEKVRGNGRMKEKGRKKKSMYVTQGTLV